MLPEYTKNQMTPFLEELGLIKEADLTRQQSTRGAAVATPFWYGYMYPISSGAISGYGANSNASPYDPNTTAGASIPADYGQGVIGDAGFNQ